jgi:hypothetical protein
MWSPPSQSLASISLLLLFLGVSRPDLTVSAMHSKAQSNLRRLLYSSAAFAFPRPMHVLNGAWIMGRVHFEGENRFLRFPGKRSVPVSSFPSNSICPGRSGCRKRDYLSGMRAGMRCRCTASIGNQQAMHTSSVQETGISRLEIMTLIFGNKDDILWLW